MNRYANLENAPDTEIICDLRSDTVTRPDAPMRAAMAEAEVGDDVMGEDPQVNRLEASLAERLGKEAGLFVTSGTQSNLAALLAHCARGEEVIVGHGYHAHMWEAGGASVLGSISIHPIEARAGGTLDPSDIAAAVRADDSHFAVSRLVSLENTHDGKAIPLDLIGDAAGAAREADLNVHLDGARFFNAITGLGCSETDLAGMSDTVSVCLSKGLGAPCGSVLVGPADLIAKARRYRKMLGGGMRQSGVLAAAGLYALEHNVDRLAEDHGRAARLGQALSQFGGVEQNTNMVFFDPPAGTQDALRAHLAPLGIRVGGGNAAMRMVVHKDVTDDGLSAAIAGIEAFYG